MRVGARLGAAAVVVASSLASAQTTTLEVYSRLTVVDVTVTDASGQPVHGLTQADFTMLEDGKPQPIRSFQEVSAQAVLPPRQLPANVYTNLQPPAPSAAVNILLLDFANIAPIESTDARQLSRSIQIQKLVKDAAMQALQQMPAGTRVAVIALTNSLHIVQSFTADRDLLAAAVNAVPYDLEGSGGGPAMPATRARNPSPFGDEDASGNQGVQANNRNRMILEALDRIATDTAGIKARKNVIWFTRGIPEITDPNERPANLPDYTKNLNQTYDLLTAAQVSVYPVDVFGVDRLGARQLSEESVAEATGGIAYSGSNDMAPAVLKAIDNGSNYYSIAYTPPSAKNDGNYHRLDVKVDKQGLQVVFRKGYYAEDVAKLAMPKGLTLTTTPPVVTKGDMKAAMSRGLPTSQQLLFDVGVEPSTVSPKSGEPTVLGTLDPRLKGKPLTRYGFQYVLPARQIAFTAGSGGVAHKAALEFDIAVYDAHDKLLTGLSQTVKMPLSDAVYQQLIQGPFRFFQQIDLPPGQLFVRVGVLDATSGKVGTLELPLKLGKK